MSGETQCERFVRNAWKKELCSNCFKGKEEHSDCQSNVKRILLNLPDPPKEGILKKTKTKKSNQFNKVLFPDNEFIVIGYGGDDVFSDDDDLPDFGDEPATKEEADTEEEKAFQRLTRTNTEFNSIPENLTEAAGDSKKPVEPLRLGVIDDGGRKKPLLVSVTPFGGKPSDSPKIKIFPKKIGKVVDLTPVENGNGVKEHMPSEETKKCSKLDAEPTAKCTEDSSFKTSEICLKRSQPIDKHFKYRPNKDSPEDVQNKDTIEDDRVFIENKLNDKLTTTGKVATLIDKAKKKVHHLSALGDQPSFKFNTIDFSSVTSKKYTENNNKGVVLDIFNIRNNTNLHNKNEVIESIDKSPPTKITPAIVSETMKDNAPLKQPCDVIENVERPKPVANVSSLHGTPERLPKDSCDDASVSLDVTGEACIISKGSEIESNDETDDAPENDCSKDKNAQNDMIGDKLENFERIISGEEVTIFSMNGKEVELELTRSAPEGRADPDGQPETPLADPVTESEVCDADADAADIPPALPASPPPAMDPRTSFLHQLTSTTRRVLGEKPKVPVKPSIIPAKKHFPTFSPRPKSPSMETFLDGAPQLRSHQPLGETLSDSGKKRPAPQPPSPKSEEKQLLRSARSSENLLNFKLKSSGDCDAVEFEDDVPAPVPRRSLSLSQDSLLNSGVSDLQEKKKSHRGRFSLRKFLHIGKHKESNIRVCATDVRTECVLSSPRPKPEIIHPLDLTGARVEVVPPHKSVKTRRSSSSASSSSGEQRESDIPSDSSTSHSASSVEEQPAQERNRKPPPPPRNHSIDQAAKPARPPPPKTQPEVKRETFDRPRDNFYVNLGEVRSTLAPSKPVRTGSLREVDGAKKLVPISGGGVEGEAKKSSWTGSLRHSRKPHPICGPPEDSGYESFDVSLSTTDSQTSSLTTDDNVYECVQVGGSTGDCEQTLRDGALRGTPRSSRILRGPRRSDGNALDMSQDYIKMRFLRSVSVPYCASEAESDIYSPYSFCGSEMGDDEYEWSPTSGRLQKVSRLKLKKGRSIVHKSLEDNYGAVVVANHEALSQVVDQMHQGPLTPPALRGLTLISNLQWSDFSIVKDGDCGVVVEQRVFYPALWGLHPVTLCLAPEQGVSPGFPGKSPFSLNSLTELHDLVPASFLAGGEQDGQELVQCSISVLNRLQIDTLQNYSRTMSNAPISDEAKKEMNFILLQIINVLKTLQAQGIEEAPKDLRHLIVVKDERDPHPRVCALPGSSADCTSLCTCLLHLLDNLPSTDLTPLLTASLREEKAVSLSRVKALLEYTLWGPVDISFGAGAREAAIQRWLDLERATVLQGLVRTRTDLSVFEEWHLLFLVRTNAKVMVEASTILESSNTSTC